MSFGGPAAAGAFLKYAFDKLLEWKKSSKGSITIKIGNSEIVVNDRKDLDRALEAYERMEKMKNDQS